jgi:DNA-binding transcriptional ArsR family regulator
MYGSQATAEALRLLGDPLRWRILRLLAREPLNVTELTAVLGIAQSGVSRHLGLLRHGGALEEARRAGWVHYRVSPTPPPGLEGLWEALLAELRGAGDPHGDDVRLAQVRRERAERGVGEGTGNLPDPGRSWAAWSRALTLLLPAERVVQLGAGSGALTLEIARWASEVVAAGFEAPRLAGGTFDLAVLSHALARAADPPAVLGEAARLVRPAGRLLVLDLLPHREAWTRERHGHRRLGVAPDDLGAWLAASGWTDARIESDRRRRGEPFATLLAVARRPA